MLTRASATPPPHMSQICGLMLATDPPLKRSTTNRAAQTDDEQRGDPSDAEVSQSEVDQQRIQG